MARPKRTFLLLALVAVTVLPVACETTYSDMYSPRRSRFVPPKATPAPAITEPIGPIPPGDTTPLNPVPSTSPGAAPTLPPPPSDPLAPAPGADPLAPAPGADTPATPATPLPTDPAPMTPEIPGL